MGKEPYRVLALVLNPGSQAQALKRRDMRTQVLSNATLRRVGESCNVNVNSDNGPTITFEYTTQCKYLLPQIPVPIVACQCKEGCTEGCPCIEEENNFDQATGLLSYHQRPLLECGPICRCVSQTCQQRVRDIFGHTMDSHIAIARCTAYPIWTGEEDRYTTDG